MNLTLKKVFEVYVFAFAFLFASRPLSDGDFWWHLKTGEYILKNHTIPKTDIFSFTNYGKAWVAHEWLSDVIFYVIYSRLGFNALIFLFAILTGVAFWIVFRRSDAHPFLSGFATLLGVWTVLPTIGVRPRVFTLLFASVYLALLMRYVRRGEGRAIWWLVPLMILWVNLHAGYVIGIVLIGLALVGILLDGWTDGNTFRSLWPRMRELAFVLVTCLVAVNLNPHGPRIYTFPFEFFFSPVQQNEIVDWLSPNFHQTEMMPLAALILLTITALVISPKRVRLSEALFFISTLYATLKSNRHMAIFALVAAPLLADYLHYWLLSTSFGKSFNESRSSIAKPRSRIFTMALFLPLLLFVFRLNSTIYSSPKQEMVGVPLKAVAYLKENQLFGNTFNDPNIWGGYFIWEMPANPVYIDGRIDMYGDEFVRDFLKIIRGQIRWQEPFDRYGVKLAVLSPDSTLTLQLQDSADWQQIYKDEMAVVFKRR